ncbi:uncharacterized protein BYT42DRAFT_562473 [Radiomyces spectabilis]|uniref:uncharacterized protein n=1 Tax=Radiomyces spectabilis TaxID=64574 RepID=UPI00221ED4B9|nr:uncharacterized protein BYT42DRAFT_562473 [Radiomyces spectabilis]KAI8384412.1 hypothetical protein BYT42DRAFT_562473 [Radiomyces spectabilis]
MKYIYLLCMAALLVNAQEAPVTTAPRDKPANLPNVDWDILRMDAANRENLCQRQIAYCANNCGGPNEAPKNFCNSTSMAWGCGCKRKVPDFTPYLWPIVQGECSGKYQACQTACITAKDAKCATACNDYYQCGSPNAPPSYLQTEYPTDTPSYSGVKKENAPVGNNNTVNPSGSNNGATLTGQSCYGLFIAIASLLLLTMNGQ